jgi:hypothetical protein
MGERSFETTALCLFVCSFTAQFSLVWANGFLQCCLALYRAGYWAESAGLIAMAFNGMRFGTESWCRNPTSLRTAPMFHADWPGTSCTVPVFAVLVSRCR